jgi:hypothetical protein
MEMIGTDDLGVDPEGPLDAHLADGFVQSVDPGDQQIRAAVEQVHGKEEGSARNPIATIANMPELWQRRNALRSSALCLVPL